VFCESFINDTIVWELVENNIVIFLVVIIDVKIVEVGGL
jgi:hypothetical protein